MVEGARYLVLLGLLNCCLRNCTNYLLLLLIKLELKFPFSQIRAKDLGRKKKLQHDYSSFFIIQACSYSIYNGSYAGSWLHSVPTRNERQMDDITFRAAMKIRLGVEFGDRPIVCKCKRHPSVDEHVDHLFNCHFFTAEVKDRHDAIVHEVHSLSQQHAVKSFSFPRVICVVPPAMMGELRMVSSGD